jgi:glycine/D-amino acid oxidase-like deaminating enzyme
LLIGEVQEVKLKEKQVVGVVVDGKLVEGDVVVLAMGPWSNRNPLISSLTKISGLKAHSIVLKPTHADTISAHTLFLK